VPGQIFGDAFKTSLLLELDQNASFAQFYRYNNVGGSTNTGMSDAFASFWYFGALKFFIIGYVISKLYKSANNNNIFAQCFLMLCFIGGLESVTHGTDRFFMTLPRLILFLLPSLYFARRVNK